MFMIDHFVFVGNLEEVQLMKLILVPEGSSAFCWHLCFLFICPFLFSFPLHHEISSRFFVVWFSFISRSRSRSRSYSPSHSRRYARGGHSDEVHRSKPRTPKIEYITEFGGSGEGDEPKLEGYSPPSSPPSQADMLSRSEHSTFNYCKDRLDSLYTAAAYPFCFLKKTFVV